MSVGEPHFSATSDARFARARSQTVSLKNPRASGVGTMAMAHLFCLIALASLHAILDQTGWFPKGAIPHFLTSPSLILVVAWIAHTFLQLVLLSVIMVGQSVQAASDARAAKTFEDPTQIIVDRLDTTTEGGIQEILDRTAPIEARLAPLAPYGEGSPFEVVSCLNVPLACEVRAILFVRHRYFRSQSFDLERW
jgi:hypothetical protein